jgi:putative transposase
MDAPHALAAARYVERNPVRAGLVKRAWQWPWSSAAAHVAGRGDGLIRPGGPLLAEVSDWRGFLSTPDAKDDLALLRRHARTGRPLGTERFVARLEKSLGRLLLRRKPGPAPRPKGKGR